MCDYQEGAKCKAVCANCGKSVPATHKTESVSLCERIEDIENVQAVNCDLCGGICSIPYKSVEPIQDAVERLLESKAVSSYGEVTAELKSQVDARKLSNNNTKQKNLLEYPQVAAAG